MDKNNAFCPKLKSRLKPTKQRAEIRHKLSTTGDKAPSKNRSLTFKAPTKIADAQIKIT